MKKFVILTLLAVALTQQPTNAQTPTAPSSEGIASAYRDAEQVALTDREVVAFTNKIADFKTHLSQEQAIAEDTDTQTRIINLWARHTFYDAQGGVPPYNDPRPEVKQAQDKLKADQVQLAGLNAQLRDLIWTKIVIINPDLKGFVDEMRSLSTGHSAAKP